MTKSANIPRLRQRCPRGESQERMKQYENEVGETTGAGASDCPALAINQLNV
jgi:hypothetical protein